MYRHAPAGAPLAIVAFGSNVVAMDRMNGRRVWSRTLPGALWRRLVVTDDRVYVCGPGRLACFAYPTGVDIWNVSTPIRTDTIVMDGAQILVGGGGEVTCFSAEDGRVLWKDGFEGMGLGDVALGFPHNTTHVDVST
jgi:outer membrane protein assembly factor BamB